jgi:hypothetical protein
VRHTYGVPDIHLPSAMSALCKSKQVITHSLSYHHLPTIARFLHRKKTRQNASQCLPSPTCTPLPTRTILIASGHASWWTFEARCVWHAVHLKTALILSRYSLPATHHSYLSATHFCSHSVASSTLMILLGKCRQRLRTFFGFWLQTGNESKNAVSFEYGNLKGVHQPRWRSHI